MPSSSVLQQQACMWCTGIHAGETHVHIKWKEKEIKSIVHQTYSGVRPELRVHSNPRRTHIYATSKLKPTQDIHTSMWRPKSSHETQVSHWEISYSCKRYSGENIKEGWPEINPFSRKDTLKAERKEETPDVTHPLTWDWFQQRQWGKLVLHARGANGLISPERRHVRGLVSALKASQGLPCEC